MNEEIRGLMSRGFLGNGDSRVAKVHRLEDALQAHARSAFGPRVLDHDQAMQAAEDDLTTSPT